MEIVMTAFPLFDFDVSAIETHLNALSLISTTSAHILHLRLSVHFQDCQDLDNFTSQMTCQNRDNKCEMTGYSGYVN